MSQLGFQSTNKQLVTVSTDDFGVITTSAGTLSNFKVGEKITGGTSGATARVSGVISATELRVKGVKPDPTTGNLFANSETITGATSTTTATIAGSGGFSMKRKQLRQDSTAPTLSTGNVTFATTGSHLTWATASSTFNTGMAPGAQILVSGAVASSGANNQLYTVTSVVDGTHLTVTPAPATAEGPVSVTTKGLKYLMTFETISSDDRGLTSTLKDGNVIVTRAARLMQSKSQVTDTSNAPTFTYTLQTATSISKAALARIRFRVTSNESVVVAGVPQITFSFNAAGTSIAAAGITSINGDGTTATIVFVNATGYKVGQMIAVASMTTAGFNNATAKVTSVSADGKTVTYANSTSGACTIGSGSVTFNATQYASYNATVSDGQTMYFDYTLSGPEATGTLSNTTAYNANGATITDIGGTTTTLSPNGNWSPAVSGVTVAA